MNRPVFVQTYKTACKPGAAASDFCIVVELVAGEIGEFRLDDESSFGDRIVIKKGCISAPYRNN